MVVCRMLAWVEESRAPLGLVMLASVRPSQLMALLAHALGARDRRDRILSAQIEVAQI